MFSSGPNKYSRMYVILGWFRLETLNCIFKHKLYQMYMGSSCESIIIFLIKIGEKYLNVGWLILYYPIVKSSDVLKSK